MVIVYKKVITAFLKSYILLTRPNNTNFQNHKIRIFTILFWIIRTTLVCLLFLLKHFNENSEFVVSEFRWLDLVNKTLYNNMEFSRQMTRTQGAELEIVPYCSWQFVSHWDWPQLRNHLDRTQWRMNNLKNKFILIIFEQKC